MLIRPIIAGLLAYALLVPVAAVAFETKARSAIAIDHATGMVLFEKDADTPLPTASMSKLMTLYMLFEAIRDDRVTTDTEFRVSKKAQAMGGSRMFVEAETTVSVDALIHGIIVQSGNDACVVVAENLAGTEEEFARQMTVRAKEIGLEHTTLKNASGWPEEGHEMSARDLLMLARRIVSEFPQYYAYFAQTEYTYNNITQHNRNPLLSLGIGADGLKTGHTSDAGYGLVGSAVQSGQRIVFVLMGLDSVSERAAESEAVVNWAFNAFDTVKFLDKGSQAAVADVWLGAQDTVPIVAPVDIQLLVPRTERNQMAARVSYNNPIEAPIQAGQPAGAIFVTIPGQEEMRFDLVAGRDVARGGLMTRIEAAVALTRDRAFALIAGSN
jgi:serine-type D-Ala-D-Ala carboxypeptidase (penicillin-binding protein 5/6)